MLFRSDAKFLELMRKVGQEGQHVTTKDKATNYAPRHFARHPQGRQFKPADYAAAMRSLLDRARIKVITEGPPSRRYEYLAITSEDPNEGEK